MTPLPNVRNERLLPFKLFSLLISYCKILTQTLRVRIYNRRGQHEYWPACEDRTDSQSGVGCSGERMREGESLSADCSWVTLYKICLLVCRTRLPSDPCVYLLLEARAHAIPPLYCTEYYIITPQFVISYIECNANYILYFTLNLQYLEFCISQNCLVSTVETNYALAHTHTYSLFQLLGTR